MPWFGIRRVLVRHWQDGSTFSKEAAAMATASAATAAAAVQEDHADQQDQCPVPEQQADLPGKAQPTSAGQGECLLEVRQCIMRSMCLQPYALRVCASHLGIVHQHLLSMVHYKVPCTLLVRVLAVSTGAVVCDLFKSHFSSLQQAMREQHVQEAAEDDDCLIVQQDRESFSTK
jgi:hypothetical protein